MKNLNLNFCKRKKNEFLIKIKIWFGFFKCEKKQNFILKTLIFSEKCRSGFNKKRSNFYFEKYIIDFIKKKNADKIFIKKQTRFLF